ncbi:hypothetical protein K2X33_08650 [bacterium]|nr:hypothetical protein [bacterium]
MEAAVAALANKAYAQARARVIPGLLDLGEELDEAWRAQHPHHRYQFSERRGREYVCPLGLRHPRKGLMPFPDGLRERLAERMVDGYTTNNAAPISVASLQHVHGVSKWRRTYYTGSDHIPHELGWLIPHNGGSAIFVFPPPDKISKLLFKAQVHLQIAFDYPQTARYFPYRIEDFAKALYLYHQAAPYGLNTDLSATGIFSGIFHSLFGKRLALRLPYTDYVRMLALSQAGFVSEISPYLRASAQL